MTHPSPSVAPPAPVHAHPAAVVADLHRGRVRDLKILVVIREEVVWLSSNVPRPGGGAIMRTVDHLT